MQNYNEPMARTTSTPEGINTKVAVPAGAVPKSAPDNAPVKSGGGAVKGFSGGLIKPTV